jgi:MoaA/NifB/PqqE/SkfB family radical SAM enzyme
MLVDRRIIFYGPQGSLARRVVQGMLKGTTTAQIWQRAASGFATRLRLPSFYLRIPLRTINVELTNYCNQKCRFCVTGLNTNRRAKGKLELGTFRKVIEHLKPGTAIQFSGYGEPFLNDRLESFLDLAHTKGLAQHVQINSNFGIVSEERIRQLLDHPFERLVISLDAMDRETFKVYKGCDEFDRVFDHIRILAEEIKKRGRVKQEIVVQMTVNRKNVHQKQGFIETITAMGMVPRLKQLNTHHSFPDKQKVTEFEVSDLSRYKPGGYSRFCEWVWGGMAVFWNGDVTVCCQDPMGLRTYGNIHDSTTTELLNTHPRRCDFRRTYFADPGLLEICRKCDSA